MKNVSAVYVWSKFVIESSDGMKENIHLKSSILLFDD